MGVAVLRRADHHVLVARFALRSHHLVKLDRFLAEARRHAKRSGEEFAGVALAVDPAGAVSLSTAGLEPLLL
ncbi:MAG: hypothetical protein JO168_09680 [Solirubrobacterales bacterium]|nr:hypothetical protein [Solirubrobacterales bacterium]MBV9716398.1 hypothetical protein [Solirubrobacterales bacterium]